MLTHRDRVLTSIRHETPDRVPVDFGGTQSGILVPPYDDLKRVLGIQTPTEVQNIVMGLAKVEQPIRERLGADIFHVWPGMPDSWTFELLPDDSFYDEWGTRWHRPPGGYYYDMVEFPLAEATLEAVEQFEWPDPDNSARVTGVADELRALRTETDYALEAGLVGLWETSWFLVGLETWFLSLGSNPDFIEFVLDGVLDVLTRMHTAYLEHAGPYLDMVTLWDDYGAQTGTLISPKAWRRLVKPRLAELISAIKAKTDAHIGMHSCGSLKAILDDLVEVGVEILNPIQVSAANMNPAELKARYGKNLVFWGGIDTFKLLPGGSPDQVARVTRQTIDTLGEDGGYILAAVHNIQPGVPAENILAMYDTAIGPQ